MRLAWQVRTGFGEARLGLARLGSAGSAGQGLQGGVWLVKAWAGWHGLVRQGSVRFGSARLAGNVLCTNGKLWPVTLHSTPCF